MSEKLSQADLAVAHYDNRKVNQIVEKTYREFRRIIDEYGTLSADQIFAIGVLVFENITIRPLERMSDRPSELRKELAQQLTLMLEKGTDEVS